MKIAIISDTHDHLENLKKFINYVKKEKISAVISCGDICHFQTFKYLSLETGVPIYLSLGNGDFEDEFLDNDLKNARVFPSLGEIALDKIKIGFSHYKKNLKFLKSKNDFFFYGHTHQPWIEEISGLIVANPGNLSNQRYQATFATLETTTKKLELKILDLHA